MKIAIADDEYLAQQTLLSMIRQIEGEWEIVGVAGNGSELLDILQEQRPDIAFVDIKMPGMNGIEAIREGKVFSPNTEWFILSGYSEFSYAQEGIQLGVLNYLLKPLSIRELREALLTAKGLIHERVADKQRQFANSVQNLCYGFEQDDIYVKDEYTYMNIQMAVVFWDCSLEVTAETLLIKQVYTSINRIVEEFAAKGVLLTCFALPSGQFTVVGAPRYSVKDKESWNEFFLRFQQIIDSWQTSELKLTIISSQEHLPLQDINQHVNRIMESSIFRILKGLGKMWNCHSFQHFSSEHHELCKLLEKLVKAYRENRYSEYMDVLFAIKQYAAAIERLLEGNGLKESVGIYLTTTMRIQLVPNVSVSRCIALLKEHGERMLQRMNKDEPSQDIVQKVIQYMKSNFRDEIGTTMIAEHFQVTPNYLSTVFHQKTGFTIMRFLTELRINKAKEILAEGAVQIQEAAELVGYFNPRHFTNLFKKIEGHSPTEYKLMLKRNV
ncbi:response regulator [Paenibacillus qinlingensis]|uniref:response regulator n=1 Tax=Paenibacillus qinlingensis TaxID=1837343 RepID=UPI001566F2A2|nr:response regulator [Paenibacillus qinlingensis]NQX58609.1 response regulator [Paenibacillus qinlingensis]